MIKILIIGSTKNKNIDLIYSVAAGLLEYEFILVGTYDNYLKLPNFKQHQNISEHKLIYLYKSSDILLFPSLSEGFGLPIIEAQYFGLPVITSKYEPMFSVAGNNSAIFINPKSPEEIRKAINTLVVDKEVRDSLIKNGYENIRKYRFENILKRYKSLYSKIIEHSIQ